MSASRPVRDGLFRDCGDGTARLLGARCADCARYHFPRAEVCPYCSCDSCSAADLGPRGRLWLYTAVLRPPPGYRGVVPFGFGVVDLEEGVRIVARLTEGDPARLRSGQPMLLVVEHLHDDDGTRVETYAFAAAEEG